MTDAEGPMEIVNERAEAPKTPIPNSFLTALADVLQNAGAELSGAAVQLRDIGRREAAALEQAPGVEAKIAALEGEQRRLDALADAILERLSDATVEDVLLDLLADGLDTDDVRDVLDAIDDDDAIREQGE